MLVVFEEAHRVVSEARPVGQREVRSLLELTVAEGRSWGVGFVVVDQSPALLSRYVVENTGTKVVHLLGAGDDIQLMRKVMNLIESYGSIFYELAVGEAVLFAMHSIELPESRLKSRLWQIRLARFFCSFVSDEKMKTDLGGLVNSLVQQRRRVAEK